MGACGLGCESDEDHDAVTARVEGDVDVEVYVCDEAVECLNPTRTPVSVKPFTACLDAV